MLGSATLLEVEKNRYLVLWSVELRPDESILLVPGRRRGEEGGGERSLVEGEAVGEVLLRALPHVCWAPETQCCGSGSDRMRNFLSIRIRIRNYLTSRIRIRNYLNSRIRIRNYHRGSGHLDKK